MAIIYPSINTSNFATNGSNSFTGNQTINGNIVLTGSLVNGNAKYPIYVLDITTVDIFSASYNAAKYTVLVETSTGPYHVQTADILLAHNNSSVLITPYGVTSTNGSILASFDAQINEAI